MFNIEIFDIKLGTDYIGRNFIYADEVESTNSYLMDKQNNIRESGTVVLAEKQTSGKGRKDREWLSQKDQNLTFSVLLTGNKKLLKKLNMINFAAALAVANSIENLFPLKTEVTWPNDVLVNGKKVSGILIESSSQGSKIDRVVVGIGVNVNQNVFQGKFNLTPTSIRNEIDRTIDRERLLAEILNIFETSLESLVKDHKFILKDWREKCRMIGERITVTEDDKSIYGIFEDIDDDGFLIIRTKDKQHKIHFGDVSI